MIASKKLPPGRERGISYLLLMRREAQDDQLALIKESGDANLPGHHQEGEASPAKAARKRVSLTSSSLTQGEGRTILYLNLKDCVTVRLRPMLLHHLG